MLLKSCSHWVVRVVVVVVVEVVIARESRRGRETLFGCSVGSVSCNCCCSIVVV